MRDGLRGLGLRQAVVHRPVEVVRDLRDLAGSYQRADGHQAAIPRRKAGTEPQIPEQNVGRVLHDPGKSCAELLSDARGPVRFGGFVQRQERTRDA
jgi:hypothetical protein